MKKLFLSFFILIFSFSFSQPGVIIPAGSSQTDFVKACKAVLSVSDNGYHESDVDPAMFAEYGEHAVYWVASGSNKGSFIVPVPLPDAYSSVTRSASTAMTSHRLTTDRFSSMHKPTGLPCSGAA